MTSTGRNGTVHLDRAACLALLHTVEVGRLAVAVSHHPDIFPVNFAVIDDEVMFRSAEGTKLAAGFAGYGIAFEADGYDPAAGEAWSVVVKGHLEEVDVFDAPDDEAYPVFPWSATPKPRFLRVVADEVTGRRFHATRHSPAHAAQEG